MYQQLANDTYDAPVPSTYSEDEIEAYKGAMAERAQVPEGADPHFDRLVQQVEALDFAGAGVTVRSLLERPN